MKLPRGIANQNPGNLRITPTKWKGKIVPSRDPEFETFASPEMGIRAMARDLLTGYRRGEDTVEKIIKAWAPPSENDTKAYVRMVAKAMGIRASEKIDVDDYATMSKLVRAIIRHENGDPRKYGRSEWYPDETIRAALFDAGVADTPGRAPATTVEGRGAQAATVGATGTAAIEAAYDMVDRLDTFREPLMSLAPYLTLAKYGLLAVTLLGAAVVAYGLFQKYRAVLA